MSEKITDLATVNMKEALKQTAVMVIQTLMKAQEDIKISISTRRKEVKAIEKEIKRIEREWENMTDADLYIIYRQYDHYRGA